MKRSPLKPSRKPIPKRSAKMKDIYERKGGRRELVARLLAERPWCEAGQRIEAGQGQPVHPSVYHVCQKLSVDCHELLRRSAGGNILDETGIICVCRACHDWIGRNPAAAESLGLSKRRWPRVAVTVAAAQSQTDLGSE